MDKGSERETHTCINEGKQKHIHMDKGRERKTHTETDSLQSSTLLNNL